MRFFALGVLLAFLPTLATADASLKSEIEALNKPIATAFMKRDVSGFKKIVQSHMTSDFVYTEGDTTMNFDQMVGRIRQDYSMYSKVTGVSFHILSVKESGTTGTAIERQSIEGIAKGPSKKSHITTIVGIGIETYRKVNGKWKMATMSFATEKMTVDGKSVPIGGAKHPHLTRQI